MSWKLVVIEIALITALVIIPCCCYMDEMITYIICIFLMATIWSVPVAYWLCYKHVSRIKREESQLEQMQSQISKKHVKELSDLLKQINKLNSKIEKCEKEYSNIKKEIENIKKPIK